jgi:putative ABC transport system permease protein
MLSTVIITSAFGTGDTLSYTIRASYVNGLGAIDETVNANTATTRDFGFSQSSSTVHYIPASTVATVSAGVDRTTVDGVTGVLQQVIPIVDLTSRQSKNTTVATGVPLNYPTAFGTLATTSGGAVTLAQLGPNQVYMGKTMADKLNAHAGDRLKIYVNSHSVSVVVRDVLSNNNLAGYTDLLMPLPRLQTLAGVPGQITQVLVSNTGDNLGGAGLTDTVTTRLRELLANTGEIAIAKSLLLTPQGQADIQHALRDLQVTQDPVLLKQFHDLQTQVHRQGVSPELKSLLSDKTVTDRLLQAPASGYADALTSAINSGSKFDVQGPKQDGLNNADLVGSFATTGFITFGLFSIASGITLIFLIFVMLAAERRAEMGMSRAIGTKRRHLIQQFIFEGYLYDLGAAIVGVILGVTVGYGVVAIAGQIFSTFGIDVQWHIEPRSIAISFCLGALVTFFTVAGSALRVSRINVVAAIRDLPDDLRLSGSIGGAFRRPFTDLANVGRRLRRGRVLGALLALLAAPWHLITAFRVFINRGPLLLAVAPLLINAGIANKQLWPFSIGISLGLVGAAMLLRWIMAGLGVAERLRNRIGFSLAGILLVIYWLLPFDALRSDLSFDIEMFFISGMFLMLGGIWTAMYNIDLILRAALSLVGGLGRLTPIIRMAVTYPMQQRFRTGMTMFMFSLVLFSLVVESVLTSSFSSQHLDLNRSIGGYNTWGVVSPSNPIHNIQAQVAADPTLRTRVAAVGGVGALYADVRQPGQAAAASSGKGGSKGAGWYGGGSVGIPDTGYFTTTHLPFKVRAAGYTSDAQVWRAVRTHPGYAVVTGDFVKSKAGSFGDFQLSGVTYEDTSFRPIALQMRDANSGTVVPLNVIGILDTQQVRDFGTAFTIYTSPQTLTARGIAPPTPALYFFRAAPGQNVHQMTLAIGSTFLQNGIDTKEAQVEYDKTQQSSIGFNELIQGFMALGLIVGIAALGVIATRSVVERRQQIGMLRALGFQRRMVRNSFLLESSFVAVLGTLIGAVLGLSLAHQLVSYFMKTQPGIQFVIPWGQLVLIVLGSYLASLLTTCLPARQASQVFPAEALRYE